ncbi:hypothetical protein MRB53_040786 [Persea americana]|nr:hypothetical protein MRB53_040786 [Persea americana]
MTSTASATASATAPAGAAAVVVVRQTQRKAAVSAAPRARTPPRTPLDPEAPFRPWPAAGVELLLMKLEFGRMFTGAAGAGAGIGGVCRSRHLDSCACEAMGGGIHRAASAARESRGGGWRDCYSTVKENGGEEEFEAFGYYSMRLISEDGKRAMSLFPCL